MSSDPDDAAPLVPGLGGDVDTCGAALGLEAHGPEDPEPVVASGSTR